MVKKTIIIAILLLFTGIRSHAQEEFQGYKSILRAQATLSAGYNIPFGSINYFLHGDLEYYMDDRISVRSDVFYFLNSRTSQDVVEPFAFQHSLVTGFQYHFSKSKLDVFMGLQPGLVLGQRQYAQIENLNGSPSPLAEPQKSVAPIVSINTGLNYYAGKFFHLFTHLRYNYGWFSDNYSVCSLSEFRISFGLGFYLRTSRKG